MRTLPAPNTKGDSDAIIINEAQLILAEKRTSLAAMRTGIAVFALPLSVLGLLIATSRYYDVLHVLPLIVPLGIMLTALIVLGSYLIIRALRNIHHYDRADCSTEKLSQQTVAIYRLRDERQASGGVFVRSAALISTREVKWKGT